MGAGRFFTEPGKGLSEARIQFLDAVPWIYFALIAQWLGVGNRGAAGDGLKKVQYHRLI